jgi:pyruvate/2-oxoglutarate/acetoin dehydrogenase E1 component
MVATALEAAEAAAEEGWDAKVIDLRSLSPVDDQTLCPTPTASSTPSPACPGADAG